jgi:5'(3')-deoxyribonucleotidase
MTKPTVAVDIDDVLALSVDKFIEWSNSRFKTTIKFDDYVEDWSLLWNISQAETTERVNQMYREGLPARYSHVGEAVEVLNKLKPGYELIVATARRSAEHKLTEDWIRKHYPAVFKDIHFAGIWDEITEHSPRKTKARLCKELGVNYLIDDQVKHCLGASSVGVKALLYGDYPWNRNANLTDDIQKVFNWKEVGDYFAEIGDK